MLRLCGLHFQPWWIKLTRDYLQFISYKLLQRSYYIITCTFIFNTSGFIKGEGHNLSTEGRSTYSWRYIGNHREYKYSIYKLVYLMKKNNHLFVLFCVEWWKYSHKFFDTVHFSTAVELPVYFSRWWQVNFVYNYHNYLFQR